MRCSLLLLSSGGSACSFVINEVEANPAGDEDAFKAPITAWFEVYNDDGKEVDISGWSITNGEGRSMVLPRGAVIRGLDYYVLDVEAGWLAHNGEVLVLLNATGAEMDRTVFLSDKEDNEGTWTRDPDGRDTNSTNDWKFLASSRGF